MSFFYSLLLVFHILIGLAVIGLVLLQHGKGADMGAAFGSGSSGSLFGASGSANFLSRTTAVLAAVFFSTSLGLSYLASAPTRPSNSVLDAASRVASPPAPAVGEVPATPASPAPNAPPGSKAQDIPK